jgi:hypothetical protein
MHILIIKQKLKKKNKEKPKKKKKKEYVSIFKSLQRGFEWNTDIKISSYQLSSISTSTINLGVRISWLSQIANKV